MGLFMKACRLDLDGGGILDIGRGFSLDGFEKTGIGRLGIGHTDQGSDHWVTQLCTIFGYQNSGVQTTHYMYYYG
jgi:hypothetical protein